MRRLATVVAGTLGACLALLLSGGATALAATPSAAAQARGGYAGALSKPLAARDVTYTATPPTAGALASDGQTNRYMLGGTWLMRLDPDNVGIADGYWQQSSSTDGWSETTMPNAFNAGDLSTASFYGSVAWYRRDFTLPAGAFASYVPAAGRSWVLQFENVSYYATVWLNGHLIGSHAGLAIPFELAAKYMNSGVNELVVRVSNVLSDQTFPPMNPSSGWWNFGGILDAVYLRPVAEADLDGVRIRTAVPCSGCAATISEQATIINRSARTQTVSLTGNYGAAALKFGQQKLKPGAVWRPTASVVIRNPRLWNPGAPQLYSATLTLRDAKGRNLGGYFYQSGIRTITVSNGLLYVNYRQVHLRGVNMHEQTATTGSALDLAQMQQLIGWVRGLGATLIREHYPEDPEIEQMADDDGIMLWSEVPVYHPTRADQASATWRASAVAEVQANIRANQDHPAILLWSIGNEFNSPPVAGQAQYIAAAAAAAKALDPTRPVGMALLGTPWYCSAEYNVLDVIGLNAYNGWFQANGTDVNIEGLSPKLDTVRSCWPNKAIIVSEIGFGGVENGSVNLKGTFQNQDASISYAFNVFNSKPWLAGVAYHILQDWASMPGWDGDDPLGTPPIVTKGLIDRYGNLKPSYYLMSKIYHATTQIAPLRQAIRKR